MNLGFFHNVVSRTPRAFFGAPPLLVTSVPLRFRVSRVAHGRTGPTATAAERNQRLAPGAGTAAPNPLMARRFHF